MTLKHMDSCYTWTQVEEIVTEPQMEKPDIAVESAKWCTLIRLNPEELQCEHVSQYIYVVRQ